MKLIKLVDHTECRLGKNPIWHYYAGCKKGVPVFKRRWLSAVAIEDKYAATVISHLEILLNFKPTVLVYLMAEERPPCN